MKKVNKELINSKINVYPAPNAQNRNILKGGFQPPVNDEAFSLCLVFKPLPET